MNKAINNNATSLGLDAAGTLIPGTSTASTLSKLSVAAAAMVNSAATGNADKAGSLVASLGLGIADFHISSATSFIEQFKNVSAISKSVQFVGNLVSLTAAGLDLANVYSDYQDCMAGKKWPRQKTLYSRRHRNGKGR